MSRTTASGRRAVLALATATVLAGAAACGGPDGAPPAAAPSAATVVSPPSIRPGEVLPAPSGAPVLTVTGRIASTNTDRALRLDPATLDRLGVVEMSVFEPWVKQTITYRGVWLADLLAAAKADGTAQGVHMTALDDYQIDLSMAEIRAGGIMLATRTGDGAPIPGEDGGPTRIVFGNGIPSGASPDQWIWSLETIDVR